jgi:MoxR-like ATPase
MTEQITSSPILSREQGTAAVKLLESSVASVIRGKAPQVRLAVACLLAEGHLLIEDKPGTGKTSLAKAMAAAIGGTVRRVQFTPDLLPSDITGVSVFNPTRGEFSFREGPAFTNILIADEINRASPKTQAALLEVMEERQVTYDGVSRPVPSPFMVVATQNPLDFQGTYPLPEVQLDRFAMKISLGYADRDSEIEVMARPAGMKMIEHMPPAFDPHQFRLVIERAREVAVSQSLRGYVADLVEATRNHHDLRLGVSTRGTLVLLAVARAFAMANSRNFVTADDIKALGVPVLAHRIALTAEAEIDGLTEAAVLQSILDQVPVPRATQAPLDP